MSSHMVGILVPPTLSPAEVRGAARAALGLGGTSTRRTVGEMMMYAWAAPPDLPPLAGQAAVLAEHLPQTGAEGWLGQTVAGEEWTQGLLWPLTSPPGVAVGWISALVRRATWRRTELSFYALSPGRYTLPVPAGNDGMAVLHMRKGAEALQVSLGDRPMTPNRQTHFIASQQVTVRARESAGGGAGFELVFCARR